MKTRPEMVRHFLEAICDWPLTERETIDRLGRWVFPDPLREDLKMAIFGGYFSSFSIDELKAMPANERGILLATFNPGERKLYSRPQWACARGMLDVLIEHRRTDINGSEILAILNMSRSCW